MSKRFIIILVVCILAVIGVFALTRKKAGAPGSSSTAQLTEHKTGAGTKGVTLVEYGDYQCPVCGDYFPLLQQIITHYGDDITFQFRNFPLISIHQNAFAGARAAEAASLQGKFWQMHDLLYEENDKYYQAQNEGTTYNTWINSSDPTTYFVQYAKQLGLNVTQFQSDLNGSAVNDTVQADLNEALKSGFTGTPTFLLDGEQIQNPSSVTAFEQIIDAEIAKKNPANKS